jgi:hypothetical protein
MNLSVTDTALSSALGSLAWVFFTNSIAFAQTIELEVFCTQYPQNSSCEGVSFNDTGQGETLDQTSQLIQVQLSTSGPDDELIWIAIRHNEVSQITELSAYHSKRLESFLNQLLNGALGAVAVPLPFDLFNIYNLQEHRTEYLAFTSDACQAHPQIVNGRGWQQADCTIAGNGTITLPEDVDIRAGYFTLGYIENDLIKAVIFRLEDQQATFVGDTNLDDLCQQFPLNSRCRFWPISSSEN